MFEQIDQELKDVKEKLRMKRKWNNQLSSYQRELDVQQRKESELLASLQNEQEDVEKLTNASMTNMLLTLTGKKDERLDQEKQEVATAQLKYDEARKTVKDMQADVKELQSKLGDVADAEHQYQNILLEKEQVMKDNDSFLTPQIYDISERKAEAEALKTELNEAISAGKRVLDTLGDARESLEKAAGWGTFDMFGGGMLSTAVKHDHIDEAQECIHQAQYQMRTFEKELQDVEEESSWDIDISGMLKFADFFFDGFISDFMVQGKINDSLEQVKDQSREIESLVQSLRTTHYNTEEKLESLESERKEILERSVNS